MQTISAVGGAWFISNYNSKKEVKVLVLLKAFKQIDNIKKLYRICDRYSNNIAKCYASSNYINNKFNCKEELKKGKKLKKFIILL